MTDDSGRHAEGLDAGGAQLSRRALLGRAAAGTALLAGGGLLPAAAEAAPRRGGNLRVAILGGSTSDTLDAGREVTQPDTLRVMALYNGLVRLSPRARVVLDLAQEMTPSKDARRWHIRLRQGVEFHNGKTLKAQDVAFTLRRIMNPKSPLNGASALKPIAEIKVTGPYTLELRTDVPYASFPEQISAVYNFGIVPVGYDPKKPVGTGPFRYQSFTPGQQSVFVRHPHYFESGMPYLDELTIIDSFGSDTAAFDALQGGQIDVFASAPFNLARQIGSSGQFHALVSLPGQWTPFTMRVDQRPFDDARVRQAMRFIVNRKQLIEQSLSGYGAVGNDIFSQWDPCYPKGLHRDQDLARARSLLKAAGHEKLAVELVTADFAPGVLQAAQVFAQQAKAAGVAVKIKQVPVGTFYGPNYLKWTFAQDFWGVSPYLSQVAQGSLPNSPFNETHWNDARYKKLYAQANATVDEKKRCAIIREMQAIDFNRGGYIIAAYNKLVDLVSPRVKGVTPAGTGVAVGNADWKHVWLAS